MDSGYERCNVTVNLQSQVLINRLTYQNQGKNMSETKETQEKRRIKCLICGQEFTSITDLAKHDANVHLGLNRKRDEQASTKK